MQPATREEEGWLAVARLNVGLNTRRFVAATTGSRTEFIHHAPLFFLSFNATSIDKFIIERLNRTYEWNETRVYSRFSAGGGEFLENIVPRNRASIGRGKLEGIEIGFDDWGDDINLGRFAKFYGNTDQFLRACK